MFSYRRSLTFTIFQFAWCLFGMITLYIFIALLYGVSVISNYSGLVTFVVITLLVTIYMIVEFFSKIQIDESYIYENKIYEKRRFKLEEVSWIEYRKFPINNFGSVIVHHVNGNRILLDYWYKDLNDLLIRLGIQTMSKNENVKISEYIHKLILLHKLNNHDNNISKD